MIWADRVAIVWAGIVYGFYFIANGGTLPIEMANWPFFGLFVLLPWLVMRGLHWIVAGRLVV